MPTLEREVEAYLRTRVEQAGGICVKFLPDLVTGMPDRVVLLPGGVVVWVETKKPKGGVVSENKCTDTGSSGPWGGQSKCVGQKRTPTQ